MSVLPPPGEAGKCDPIARGVGGINIQSTDELTFRGTQRKGESFEGRRPRVAPGQYLDRISSGGVPAVWNGLPRPPTEPWCPSHLIKRQPNKKDQRRVSQPGESPRGFGGSGRWALRPGAGDPADGAGGSFLAPSAPCPAPRTRVLGRSPRGKQARVSPRGLCLGRAAGCIVPGFGERGSRLVQGNLSLGKGRGTAQLDVGAASVDAAGGCGKLAERGRSVSPEPHKTAHGAADDLPNPRRTQRIKFSRYLPLPHPDTPLQAGAACLLRGGEGHSFSFQNLPLKALQVILTAQTCKLSVDY